MLYRTTLAFIGLMLSAIGCLSEDGKVFYLSPEGKIDASGSKADPVSSLHRAVELAQPFVGKQKVTFWLAGGRYAINKPLELGKRDGGSAEGPIHWKAQPNEIPVISGGIPILEWQQHGEQWIAAIPEEIPHSFRSLYINGRRAVRARFPNTGYLRIKEAGEDNRTNFFFHEGDFPRPEVEADLELILLHDWSITRIGVRSIDWQKNQLFTIDSIGSRTHTFFSLTNWEKQPRYLLENAKEYLDTPGEWYADFDQQKIYYYPLAGESIQDSKAYIPLASSLLTIHGDHDAGTFTGYMHFEGLAFEHTSWTLPSDRYAGIQACMFDNRYDNAPGWDQVPAAITLTLAEHCTFTKCDIRHTGGSGLWIGEASRSCAVSECHFYDISGNGIMIGEGRDRRIENQPWWKVAPDQVAKDNLVQRSLIETCGTQFFGAVGIWGGLVEALELDRNEIRHMPYTGISLGWMWDTIPTPCAKNVIKGNHIHDIMKRLSDGGGIYSLGLQPESLITGNLIHDVSVNTGRAESNGMFLDEGTKDVLISDNVIYNIARSPLRFHRASINVVRNNVLQCEEGIPPIRYNTTPESHIKKEGNLILQSSVADDQATLKSILDSMQGDVGPVIDF